MSIFIFIFIIIIIICQKKDNRTELIYGNSTLSPKSSLKILSGSLQSNQTYQFMVSMTNRQNPSIQATGYILVTIVDGRPPLIVIG